MKSIEAANSSTSMRFIDGTFKVVRNLQLMIIGVEYGVCGANFLPFGMLLTNRKTEKVYRTWFEELKQSGLKWKAAVEGMSDLEFGIANAAESIFPKSKGKWNLCWFHVMQLCGKKLRELKIGGILREKIFY